FISGFVLMVPFARARLAGGPAPSWRHFFGRRVMKIVPSYVLCIALLIAFGYQTYANAGEAIRDVAFHLLFVHNWFLVTYGSINGVLWSLGVEIQFYLLFPLFVAAFVRRPLITAAVMLACANAWRIWAFAVHGYYLDQREAQLPAYLDLFALGMLAAYMYVDLSLRPALVERRRWLFSLIMVAGIAGFLFLAGDCYALAHVQQHWPELWKVQHRTLLAVAIGATALGSLFAFRPLQLVLANPVLLFLAAISYNLYLWHQVVARVLLEHRLPPFAGADPHYDPAWQLRYCLIAVPATIAVATIVTYGFERPLLRMRFGPKATQTGAAKSSAPA
ncbi:MAG TPA: acyltransferase, partial [Candidatus Elarobacter sp.]